MGISYARDLLNQSHYLTKLDLDMDFAKSVMPIRDAIIKKIKSKYKDCPNILHDEYGDGTSFDLVVDEIAWYAINEFTKTLITQNKHKTTTTIRSHYRRTAHGRKVIVKTHIRTVVHNRKKGLRPITSSFIYDVLHSTKRLVTKAELVKKLRMHPATVEKYMESLEKEGKVERKTKNGREYWIGK